MQLNYRHPIFHQHRAGAAEVIRTVRTMWSPTMKFTRRDWNNIAMAAGHNYMARMIRIDRRVIMNMKEYMK